MPKTTQKQNQRSTSYTGEVYDTCMVVRVTEKMYSRLKYWSKMERMKLSEFVRIAALDKMEELSQQRRSRSK